MKKSALEKQKSYKLPNSRNIMKYSKEELIHQQTEGLGNLYMRAFENHWEIKNRRPEEKEKIEKLERDLQSITTTLSERPGVEEGWERIKILRKMKKALGNAQEGKNEGKREMYQAMMNNYRFKIL